MEVNKIVLEEVASKIGEEQGRLMYEMLAEYQANVAKYEIPDHELQKAFAFVNLLRELELACEAALEADNNG